MLIILVIKILNWLTKKLINYNYPGDENDKSDEGSISSEESHRQEENNADGSSKDKENVTF